MIRKQIGWKLKDIEFPDYKLKDAIRIGYGPFSSFTDYENASMEILRAKFKFNPAGQFPFSFGVQSTVEDNLKNSGLLQELFEPVYDNTGMKCIGYKAPMKIFSEAKNPIVAGTIYYPCPWYGFYMPKDISRADEYKLPKEIVETWEPVYEPEEIELTIGGSSTLHQKSVKVVVRKGNISVENGNSLSISDIIGLHDDINSILSKNRIIDGKNVNYPVRYSDIRIKIGCTEFTPEEISKVVEAYGKLNS